MNIFKMAVAGVTVAVLFTSCSKKSDNSPSFADTVNVADAIEDLTEITTSMLGESIRFIPLETTDRALVGGSCVYHFNNEYAIIGNVGDTDENMKILVYELKTGRFVTTISRHGQGPEDFFNLNILLDINDRYIYFPSGSGQAWCRFDFNNNYIGRVLSNMSFNRFNDIIFNDTIALTLSAPPDDDSRRTVFKYHNMDGDITDSIVAFENQHVTPFATLFKGVDNMTLTSTPFKQSHNQAFILQKDNKLSVNQHSSLYMLGNELRYTDGVTDTIYSVTRDGTNPVIYFDFGDGHDQIAKKKSEFVPESTLILSSLIESPESIPFGVTRGFPKADKSNIFVGLYDRATKSTLITPASNGIADDLGGFLPFNPVGTTPSGTLVGVLTSDDIDEWIEVHPGTKLPPALSGWKPEDNPVLVLID